MIMAKTKKKASKKKTKKVRKKTTKKVVRKAKKKVAKKAVKKSSKKTAKKATKKIKKKLGKRVTKKKVKKATKKTIKKTVKKATKKIAKKTTPKVSSKAVEEESMKLSKEEAIDKYRKGSLVVPLVDVLNQDNSNEEVTLKSLEEVDSSTSKGPSSLDSKASPSSLLSDEYNVDDEVEDDSEAKLAYGWEYEDTLDDPESIRGESALDDEDEAYARGLDKEL